ncbi:head-to-tail stopper [Microbacterium phage Footloose]|uniref:Head-to-tail stopper n=1 Tax=Microbacterium phage Footloose TaxID=2836048 RepID=A0A8F3ECQ5_9CAUD|nr:head-to-tail stopper [Microbacterium phage Footloose]QWY84590.1 head-to-tail stopper [Microbacterium phage Footloose]
MRGARMIYRGRRLAESRMSEDVTVGSFTDGVDEETGEPIRVPVVSRYSGGARIRWGSREVTNADAPMMPVTVQEPYLSVPVGTPLLHDNDEVLVVASESDQILVGRRFRVQGFPVAGQVTAHRYPLEELG